MKKVLGGIILTLLFMPAFAGIDTGIDAGMTHVSLLGGFAAPISDYKLTSNIEYGDSGPVYGAQIMHYLTPHFGLGAEFNATNYQEAEGKVFGIDYKNSADRYAFMLAGKIVFVPQAKTRFYIPFGAGFNRFKGKVKSVAAGVDGSETCTEPAFYTGLGIETDLNDIFIFGIEGRYNGFGLDKDKFNTDNSYLDDAALLLKFGIKF